MELQFIDAWDAPRCHPSLLETVELDLTEQDIDHFNDRGWESYRAEDFREVRLPELGSQMYFGRKYSLYGDKNNPIASIKGKNYIIQLKYDYRFGEAWESKGKSLVLTETNLPVSVPDCTWRSSFHLFGQPRWVQSPIYPLDLRGKPCYHLLTDENGWGDSGNYNILIGFDENDIPNVAYFEASCC